MPVGGAYILVLEFEEDVEVNVGALGRLRLRRGTYAYVGSARGGIDSRVGRHLSSEKRRRWHIDYLTGYAADLWAIAIPARDPPECAVAEVLRSLGRGVVKGFGAGDCACPSHLVYLGELKVDGRLQSTPTNRRESHSGGRP